MMHSIKDYLAYLVKSYAPPALFALIADARDCSNFKTRYNSFLKNKRHLVLKLDTNNVCNLRCVFCYRQGEEANRPRFMTVEEFRRIAETVFPVTSVLSLSCATEPTITKNFEDYIRIASSYGIPTVEYVTNGLLLNERIMKESVRSEVSRVFVSIDASRKPTYEAIRINSDFDKVIENLALFKRMKEEMKSGLPEIVIEYTAFDRNAEESCDFVRERHDLFDTFFFNHLQVRMRNDSFKGARLDKNKFNAMTRDLRTLCKRHGKSFISSFNGIDNACKRRSKCPMAICYRLIASDGDVTLCNKEKLCNIYRDDYFEAVKASPMINAMIKRKHPYCEICGS